MKATVFANYSNDSRIFTIVIYILTSVQGKELITLDIGLLGPQNVGSYWHFMEYLLYVKVSAMIYLFCQPFNNSNFFTQFTYSLSCFFFPSLFLSPTIQKFLPVRKFIICLLFTTIDLVCGNDVAMDLFSCVFVFVHYTYIYRFLSLSHIQWVLWLPSLIIELY